MTSEERRALALAEQSMSIVRDAMDMKKAEMAAASPIDAACAELQALAKERGYAASILVFEDGYVRIGNSLNMRSAHLSGAGGLPLPSAVLKKMRGGT